MDAKAYKSGLCAEMALALHEATGLPLGLISGAYTVTQEMADRKGSMYFDEDVGQTHYENCHAVVIVSEKAKTWLDVDGEHKGLTDANCMFQPDSQRGAPIEEVVLRRVSREEVEDAFAMGGVDDTAVEEVKEFLLSLPWFQQSKWGSKSVRAKVAKVLLAVADKLEAASPEEGDAYDRLYHTSSPLVRNKILAHGLLPGMEASYGPPAVYLWKDVELATNYYWVDDQELLDVWEVDPTGLTVEDDPEDAMSAVYTTKPISSDKIKLIGTFISGEMIPQDLVSELIKKGHPTKPLRKVKSSKTKVPVDVVYRSIIDASKGHKGTARDVEHALTESFYKSDWTLQLVNVHDHMLRYVEPHNKRDVKRYSKTILTASVPPVCLLDKGDYYEVVDGAHRIAAARLAGRETLPAFIGTKS